MSGAPRVPYIDLVAQHAGLRAELLAAVDRVLQHGMFILGPEVAQLEAKLAVICQAKHVIGLNSGTDALWLALRALNIGPGDEVITVSHSFVATASAIALVGATPVFVDVDEDTLSMDIGRVQQAITPRTRAIMPVHLGGIPCEMSALSALAADRGITLIEDCAQAIGATLHGKSVGSFGVGCFSLHPLKVLSACGDAGFITTSDDALAQQLKLLRNIGLRDRDHCQIVSGNSRLDTIQAAMLLVKVEYLDKWIEARRAHARAYREALRGHYRLVAEPEGSASVFSTFVIRTPRRDELIRFAAERGVELKIHYPLAIHQQEAFATHKVSLPTTERAVREIVSLPVTPELDAPRRAEVIAALLAFAKDQAA